MDKQAILNGTFFTISEHSETKFQLRLENWNDFGYKTLYTLWMVAPCIYPIKLADLRIFNPNQKPLETPTWGSPTPIVFISHVKDAENLFLMLSPSERKKLIDALLIRFDNKFFQNEKVFVKGVLRNRTLEEFIEAQETIKNLVLSPIDAKSMLSAHRDQLQIFLKTVY